jgi:hypothetical protein
MVCRSKKVDCYFCFYEDIHTYFSSTVSEHELDCQIGLLPAPFLEVCKFFKNNFIASGWAVGTLSRHSSFVWSINASRKIIIRLDSMMKCSAFSNLIMFLCGKRNVNRLRNIYFKFFKFSVPCVLVYNSSNLPTIFAYSWYNWGVI